MFSDLPDSQLEWMAEQCTRRRLAPAQRIFQRGEPGDCMYVVASGAVDLAVFSPRGSSILLTVVTPPTAFGELAMIDGGPRTATAQARGHTELVRVPRPAVLALLQRDPSVAAALLRSLAALVRRLDDRTSTLSLERLPARVRRFLLEAALSQNHEAVHGDVNSTLPVDLPLSQEDLARQVGGSRQQVNRILIELEAIGAIDRNGARVVAVRPWLLDVPD